MRIGVIGTIWFQTPPTSYGGTEEVVANLVNGLTRHGHEVTLFGPATAKVDARLVPTIERPLSEMGIGWDDTEYTKKHLETAFAHAHEFDIMHFHLNKKQDYYGLPLAASSETPVLTTLHFDTEFLFTMFPDRLAQLQAHAFLPYTSISNSQQQGLDINFVSTVYNSLDGAQYPFVPTPDDYYVWIGKVKPEKGTALAIRAAKMAGVNLKLMGAVDDDEPAYKRYYEEEVKPLLDGQQIEWLGEVGLPEKAVILGRAKAFLNPIQWQEPFGMVMAESQATGTPVIAFDKGAAKELVVDGKTGFIVNSLEEMVKKIPEVEHLDRAVCREHIVTTFPVERMVKGYEAAYNEAIATWVAVRAKAQQSH